VTFNDEQSMRDAIDAMNGKMLDGRSITVNPAQSRGNGGGGGGSRDRGDRGYGGGGVVVLAMVVVVPRTVAGRDKHDDDDGLGFSFVSKWFYVLVME
jgi:RNA recognition motif-containing protein